MIYSYATKAWHPIIGCDSSLPCNGNCWGRRTCRRIAAHGKKSTPARELHRLVVTPEAKWTGTVVLQEKHLLDPLKWRAPQIVATGYHGDLFLAPDDVIDRAFAVMALCPQHAFLTLTKRADRMREWFSGINKRRYGYWCEHGGYLHDLAVKAGIATEEEAKRRIHEAVRRWRPELPEKPESLGDSSVYSVPWPLPNVFLGVSITNQADADERIPLLLQTPAARRWVSIEPMLGPVDLFNLIDPPAKRPRALQQLNALTGWKVSPNSVSIPKELRGLDWVVLGGESGSKARPMHPEWAHTVRDQCVAAGVPFYFKQWGCWRDRRPGDPDSGRMIRLTRVGRNGQDLANATDGGDVWMQRFKPKNAGRLLDGCEWLQLPEALQI